jgi:small conductance mechanosensitive channel
MFSFSLIPTAFAQVGTARNQTEGGLSEFFSDLVTMAPLWFAAIIVIIVSFLLAKFVKKIVGYRVAKKRQHDVSREYIILIERATWAGVVLLGFIIAFGIVGINVTSLLGFLGLGLGFAFKDLLANFIAGVVILTQKKFHIDDVVSVNGIIGKIVEIETRTTQVEAFDGTVHIIPNADMLTSVVQNLTTNSFRRIAFQVGVHYDTPLQDSVSLTLDSVKSHPNVVPEPKTQVLVTEFADSAIVLEVRFWIESLKPWPGIQSEIMQKLKMDYDKAGITIPFPMTTLTLDSYDKNIKQAFHLPMDDPKHTFPAPTQAPVKPEVPIVQPVTPPTSPTAGEGK